MAQKIEIFSAGCAVCQETVEMVRRIAGTSHTIEVLDMQRADVVARRSDGVQRVPSVVIDGQLAVAARTVLRAKRLPNRHSRVVP